MKDDDLAADMLDGITAIAAYMNISARRAYHLAENGKIPVFKFEGGRKWQGRKSTLRRHVENLEVQRNDDAHGRAA
jgi:excisionase family DNA binding protein